MAVKLKGATAATNPWREHVHQTLMRRSETVSHYKTTRSHLQPAVQHGVGASLCVDRLLLLQLDGVFGVESEEVDELSSGVDLRLDHGFTLNPDQTEEDLLSLES